MSGSYAYVTGRLSDSLAVVDVSNPAAPAITGSVASSAHMDGVRRSSLLSPVARMRTSGRRAPSSPPCAPVSPPLSSLQRSQPPSRPFVRVRAAPHASGLDARRRPLPGARRRMASR